MCLVRNTGTIAWIVTQWRTSQKGGWSTQPIICVEGEPIKKPSTPKEAAEMLLALHQRPELECGNFHTLIGEFLDADETGKWSDPKPEEAFADGG